MGDHMVSYEPDHDVDDYEEDFEEEELEEEPHQNSLGVYVMRIMCDELQLAPASLKQGLIEEPADETPQETPRLMCEEGGVHCVAEDDDLDPVLQLQQLRESLDAFTERMDAVHQDVVDEDIDDAYSPADSPTRFVVEEGDAEGHEQEGDSHDQQDRGQQGDRLRCEAAMGGLNQAKHRATEMLQKFMEASALEAAALEQENHRAMEEYMAAHPAEVSSDVLEDERALEEGRAPEDARALEVTPAEVHEFTVSDRLRIFDELRAGQ